MTNRRSLASCRPHLLPWCTLFPMGTPMPLVWRSSLLLVIGLLTVLGCVDERITAGAFEVEAATQPTALTGRRWVGINSDAEGSCPPVHGEWQTSPVFTNHSASSAPVPAELARYCLY